jgi:hypothetical protein
MPGLKLCADIRDPRIIDRQPPLRQRMSLRSIATALLLVTAAPTHAQVYDYDHWEQPRNGLTIPVSTPVAVDIYLPQKQIYALDISTNPMMGGLVGALMMNKADGINDRQDGVAARLMADMPEIDYGKLLHDAFAEHVGPGQFAQIKRITVHRSTPAEVEKATPGDPDEQTLSLVVRYYLSPALRDLRVVMAARLGPRALVTAPPRANRHPDFNQYLVYDVPGTKRTFASEESRSAVWSDMGGDAIANHVRAGMEDVMAMLAYELGARPTFGRVPGKQIAWAEGQTFNYGVAESHMGDRMLVRLRNGVLVSLPER